ncbi:MAG: DUF4179 domain-containing protein [Lachnospiraceae bacterium]|nr:DUF4179 domain-containing protein [Lachnospiraceae bacterium]
MSEKDFYVSQMEKLKVSEELKQHMLHDTKHKKTNISINYRLGIPIAAALVFLLTLFVIPSPLSSEVKANCKLAFHSINEMIYGAHEDVSNYTTKISQTDTDGDVTLQLNEAIIDGTELICTFTLTCDTERFFTTQEKNSATYEGYYDLLLDSITVNGHTKKNVNADDKKSLQLDSFMQSSTDSRSYWAGGTYNLQDFADMLTNPDDILKIKLNLSAVDYETDDTRHFSYTFQIANRALQLKTSEVLLNRSYELDGMTLVLDKLCINEQSQKIYYHIDNPPAIDRKLEKEAYDAVHNAYQFVLNGTDNRGITVLATFDLEGPGYSKITTLKETDALDQDVQYYNFTKMHYVWTDPAYNICDDAHEGDWHGRIGDIGEPFQINCK